MKTFVVAALLVAAAAESYFRLPSPYSYSCVEGYCVKQKRSDTTDYSSLDSCQLNCGQSGGLWPRPTGEMTLSQETVSFSPLNMRVTKRATSDRRVARMLENAIQHFTRTIHYMHPDFPKSQKKPMSEREFEQLNRFEQQQNEDSNQQQYFRSDFEREQNRRPFDYQSQQSRQRQRFDQEESPTYCDFSPFYEESSSPRIQRQRMNIEITITASDNKLRLDTDESYNLVIQTVDDETTVTILATTYYGARHALETLSQLITYDDINNGVEMVRDAQIRDKPSFKYRGFMLDTGRNFYPKEDLMRLLDAMSYNKLNYFHWHINDAASFPMYSTRLPKFTYYGAYDARKVYYPEDIKAIVEYANLRGISVIPEIGGPAHNAAGWQWAQEEGKGRLALCTDSNEPWFEMSKEPPSGQFNPVNPELYKVLGELYRDVMDYFDPEMVHMAGDDVSFKCWQNSPEIKEYFQERGIEASSREYFELWNDYQKQAFAKLQEAAQGRKVTPIIHSSSFARNYVDKETYVLQLNDEVNDTAITDYVDNGYRVIFSNQDQWTLGCDTNTWVGDKARNCPSEPVTWEQVYRNSPFEMLEYLNVKARSPLLEQQVLGGEATLWSFDTDANSLQSRAWPRLSAFAERLWTDPQTTFSDTFLIQKRLNVQRKRMVYRGIQADPLQPEYCMHDETACYSQEQYRARFETNNQQNQ